MDDLNRALDSVPPRPPEKKKLGTGKIVMLLILALVIYGGARCGLALVGGGQHAEEAVLLFHKELDAGACLGIWTNAAPTLRQTATEAGFLDTCKQWHVSFGDYVSTTRTGISVRNDNGNSSVQTVHETKYTHGVVNETFLFSTNGSTLKLLGYQYNAPELKTVTP